MRISDWSSDVCSSDLHNARADRYAHLRLTRRAGDAKPPRVRVLDVRKRPLDAALSTELLDAAGQALDTAGPVLVVKNRRGYAPVLLCPERRWGAQGNRCDAPITDTSGERQVGQRGVGAC